MSDYKSIPDGDTARLWIRGEVETRGKLAKMKETKMSEIEKDKLRGARKNARTTEN